MKHSSSVFFILGLDCVPAWRGCGLKLEEVEADYVYSRSARLRAGAGGA